MGLVCHDKFPFYHGYGYTYMYFEPGSGQFSFAFQKVKDEFWVVEIKDHKARTKAI